MAGQSYLDVLQREFLAEEGSFLLKLRSALDWDEDAFARLTAAMRDCCDRYEGRDLLDRWLAQGFWYTPRFVRDWTTHPTFPRLHADEFYDRAYQYLDDLAVWFFDGVNPF